MSDDRSMADYAKEIKNILASIREQHPCEHTHRVWQDIMNVGTDYHYVVFLDPECPACDRLRSTNAIYRTQAYLDYWNHRNRRPHD